MDDFLKMTEDYWQTPKKSTFDNFFFKLKLGYATDNNYKNSPQDHDEWQKVLSAAEERDENDLLGVMYFLRCCGCRIENRRLFWGCLDEGTKQHLRKFLLGSHYDFMMKFFSNDYF